MQTAPSFRVLDMSGKIHTIHGQAASAEKADYSSLQTKLAVYQQLNREWAQHLDPYQFRVLFAIVDRTIGWGALETQISAGSLLRGNAMYGPLNIGRSKFYEALSSLEAKGLIRRRSEVTNPDKVHYGVCPNWGRVPTSDAPKSGRNSAKNGSENLSATRTSPVRNTDTPCPPHGPNIQVVPFTDNLRTGSSAAPRVRDPSEFSDNVREDDRAATDAASPETRTNRGNAARVEGAWRRALAETFPDAVEPVWTAREKVQANRLAKGWMHGRQISFIDFTGWAVRNWTAIMREQFKWMKQAGPPAVPAFGFYVHMIQQFAECWGERKLEEWASAKERTEVERRMSRGMTFEEATADYAKQHAMGQLRDEMRKREIKVRARSRAADAKLKQAEQLAEFGGKAPVHPRSIAAQEMRATAHQSDPPAVPAPERPDEAMPPLSAPMVDPNQNPFD